MLECLIEKEKNNNLISFQQHAHNGPLWKLIISLRTLAVRNIQITHLRKKTKYMFFGQAAATRVRRDVYVTHTHTHTHTLLVLDGCKRRR